MNPKLEQYEQFTDFVGAQRPEYFIILNPQTRRKYILDVEK
mgnify:CR=1 FL=1